MQQLGEGTLDHLCAPDVLLPEQYFARLAGSERSAEQELAFAVLNLAIRDFQRGVTDETSTRRIRDAQEAEEWLFENNLALLSAFSFAGVCEALGIDPDYLRRGLRAWKAATAVETRVEA